jgi:hypothetical protein
MLHVSDSTLATIARVFLLIWTVCALAALLWRALPMPTRARLELAAPRVANLARAARKLGSDWIPALRALWLAFVGRPWPLPALALDDERAGELATRLAGMTPAQVEALLQLARQAVPYRAPAPVADEPATPRPPPLPPATLLALAMVSVGLMVGSASLAGCPSLPAPDGCTPSDQRCSPEGVPQVCSQTALRSDVLPGAVRDDRLNHRTTDMKLAGERELRGPAGSKTFTDLTHELLAELCAVLPLAAGAPLRVQTRPVTIADGNDAASLRVHVVRVIRRRPQEQVRRVHARRVVAVVADVHPIGDRAVREFPGHPVGQALAPVPSETSVPARGGSCAPAPAVAGLVDLVPEALDQRRTGHVLACLADSLPAVLFASTRVERFKGLRVAALAAPFRLRDVVHASSVRSVGSQGPGSFVRCRAHLFQRNARSSGRNAFRKEEC